MRKWLYGAAAMLAIGACGGDRDLGTEPNAVAPTYLYLTDGSGLARSPRRPA